MGRWLWVTTPKITVYERSELASWFATKNLNRIGPMIFCTIPSEARTEKQACDDYFENYVISDDVVEEESAD